MADYNSSLPVRTQTNGDVVVFIADSTTPSQLNAVDTHGSLSVLLKNAAGTATTSQANGAQQALDVGINVAGVQIDPRSIRALTSGTDSVTTVQGTSPWITKDQSDGPVTPGTVASFSQLMGGQFNTVLPTLTNTQQSAIQVDSSGRLLVVLSGTSTVTVSNFPTTVDTNYGTVGASTIRTASQIGNATGAADFNAGATGAQTLRTVANQGAPNSAANAWPISVTSGGTLNSPTNPLFVSNDTIPGTSINDYKRAIAIAAGASDTHDYTVTAGKTLYLNQIESTGSGKAKVEVEIETGVGTGTFTTRWVQFNSTADPNMTLHIDNAVVVAAGVRVRVVITNKDVAAADLYTTISGFEI